MFRSGAGSRAGPPGVAGTIPFRGLLPYGRRTVGCLRVFTGVQQDQTVCKCFYLCNSVTLPFVFNRWSQVSFEGEYQGDNWINGTSTLGSNRFWSVGLFRSCLEVIWNITSRLTTAGDSSRIWCTKTSLNRGWGPTWSSLRAKMRSAVRSVGAGAHVSARRDAEFQKMNGSNGVWVTPLYGGGGVSQSDGGQGEWGWAVQDQLPSGAGSALSPWMFCPGEGMNPDRSVKKSLVWGKRENGWAVGMTPKKGIL